VTDHLEHVSDLDPLAPLTSGLAGAGSGAPSMTGSPSPLSSTTDLADDPTTF